MDVNVRILQGESMSALSGILEGESEVYVVYDRNVEGYARHIAGAASMALETSEELKTIDTVMDIERWLMECNASRQALVVAVGGGITTDLVGFAASIYKRGVRYANVPTTLLAQVDAAIGGKTGVNLDGYKNMVGVFSLPEFTFLCPEVLETLPEREYKAGFAELLKTFLLADAALYRAAIEGTKPIVELVLKAAEIKAGVVRRDPFEKGERAKLNLGHTFAHAIEHEARIAGKDIVHGEAVAMGIIMAAELSEAQGIAEKGLAARLRADFKANGLPTECPFSGLEAAMAKDKKAAGGKIRFILPVREGEVVIKDLTV